MRCNARLPKALVNGDNAMATPEQVTPRHPQTRCRSPLTGLTQVVDAATEVFRNQGIASAGSSAAVHQYSRRREVSPPDVAPVCAQFRSKPVRGRREIINA